MLGRVYTNLGLYDQATPLLRRALAQHRALYGEDHLAVAEDMERLGDALMQQDQYDEAEPLLREAARPATAAAGQLQRHDRRGALERLATLYQRRNEYAAAEPLFREALAIRRRLFGDTALVVAQSLSNLGVLLFEKGAYERGRAAVPGGARRSMSGSWARAIRSPRRRCRTWPRRSSRGQSSPRRSHCIGGRWRPSGRRWAMPIPASPST